MTMDPIISSDVPVRHQSPEPRVLVNQSITMMLDLAGLCVHLQGQKAKRVYPTITCHGGMWTWDIIERVSKDFFLFPFFPTFFFLTLSASC